jgi:crotonobetainyl-CoA:carnitine CoA-transferase CaiB-like acyl-CoA transferase
VTGPLAHLKVLDLSRVLAGPWAGQALGDLGADVVKVERPGVGDDTRAWGPPWVGEGTSTYFLAANRSKRSVAVDLGTEAGRDVVRALARRADVVLENWKPGTLERWGLSPADLLAANPRLVVASIRAFPEDGPDAERPGYDLLVQAMGGLMAITGQPDGPPTKVGVAVADLMTGMYALSAVLAALLHRDRAGQGQHLTVSLLDAQVAWLANQGTATLATGRAPGRLGSAHPSIVPYQAFPTADGELVIACGNDGQFAALARVLGRPGWSGDPRFATNADRVAHRDELVPAMTEVLATRPRAAWIDALDAAGVPAGPVRGLDEVLADPHVRARSVVRQPLADGTPADTLAWPVRFGATPVVPERAPPTLGAHTAEVLADWLGWDAARVEALRAAGALG